jgi:CheY-like chemotaxis protein
MLIILFGRRQMTGSKIFLKGKRVLAVDDEEDILETIADILEEAIVDTARDYKSASRKIKENRYDIAILDIMGVNGLKLLEESVERGIPAVMLTAHAINPETLMSSIDKGAIAYLDRILSAHLMGEPPWKLLFDLLGDYFDQRFGPDWKKKDKEFWTEFSRNYHVGKGIRERLMHDERIRGKGV